VSRVGWGGFSGSGFPMRVGGGDAGIIHLSPSEHLLMKCDQRQTSLCKRKRDPMVLYKKYQTQPTEGGALQPWHGSSNHPPPRPDLEPLRANPTGRDAGCTVHRREPAPASEKRTWAARTGAAAVANQGPAFANQDRRCRRAGVQKTGPWEGLT
jgi:hypothetical protein